MAASSTTQTSAIPATTAGLAAAGHRTDTPPPTATKTLRGLNKPKCIQCGNVARSRCPYQSCKSCCSKAQNPCHIHVLKANATFPEKTPPSNSPIFSQQATEASSSGSSLRVASLRQLSNNFSQYNNVQMPLRSKKPLTKKDAAAINEWRFAKLKEFRDRHIEVENEAFDRYIENVGLLEEVFAVDSLAEGSLRDGSSMSVSNTTSSGEKGTLKDGSSLLDSNITSSEANSTVKDGCSTSNSNITSTEERSNMISEMKLKLRSNLLRKEFLRKRIHDIIDRGLKKLQKSELNNSANGSADQNELDERPKTEGWNNERALLFRDLNEKLNKARNAEDLKSCLDMHAQILSHRAGSSKAGSEDLKASVPDHASQDDQKARSGFSYCPPKSVSFTEIDQETLNIINAHFSSLEHIGNL